MEKLDRILILIYVFEKRLRRMGREGGVNPSVLEHVIRLLREDPDAECGWFFEGIRETWAAFNSIYRYLGAALNAEPPLLRTLMITPKDRNWKDSVLTYRLTPEGEARAANAVIELSGICGMAGVEASFTAIERAFLEAHAKNLRARLRRKKKKIT